MPKEFDIFLPSVKRVQEFVNALVPLEGDFEIVDAQHVLDARSLMGYFGFDLSKPLHLKVYNDTPTTEAALRPFLSKED